MNGHFLASKVILKVKRDFNDPYLWILAKNNEVYRINSVTKTVDNYTSQFSSYSNLQFIDIAGQSANQVFIATANSIIFDNNGTFSQKNTTDGIAGNINSIGVSYRYNATVANVLLIGTDKGLYIYDFSNNQIISNPGSDNTAIFEATYRREMFSDYRVGTNISPNSLPVLFLDYTNASFGSYIFRNGTFGTNITSAFYTTGTLYPYIWGESYNLFWGTEKGLFQTDDAPSLGNSVYDHYLDNIKINKITDIYGLASFGNANTKENLLVGTDQGLYFSSSLYWGVATTSLVNTSFYHYDELGNIPINDVCVNAASTQNPICEDGIWLATNDGVYLIKPDYAKYNNAQSITAIHFENNPTNISSMDICAGSSINAHIDDDVTATIQWYKDGNEISAAIAKQLSIDKSGEYYAVIYDPCGDIHLETNHLKVNVIEPPAFTFNYPDELRYCSGTPVTLKAVGTTAYQYRWYKDGTLTGDITPSLSITQTGKYKVEVSSCDGSWVPSKEIQVDLIDLPVPVIATDKPAYCIGDNATLSIAVPVDPNYTINWYKDNALLAADINQTSVITGNPGIYTVTIVNNQANSDGTVCNQTFVAQPLIFNPPPTVSIQTIVKTTLCDGQTVDLKVTYNAGTVKWSTGETNDQITVINSGSYKATVTIAAGCSVDNTVVVQFFPNPNLNIPNAGVCVVSHKTATLTAPAGLISYTWNGQTGSNTYTTDHPQTVTLTVTDVNGCTATQQIQVNDECPDVKIPNAFTPNGDGINDTWDIIGLEYDQTALVRIFTRYGQQVYQSKGYGTPWNGEAKGQQLPTGAYYYIITAKNGSQTYSGEVTIIH